MIIKSKSYKKNRAFKTVIAYILREAEQDGSFVLTRFIKGKDFSAEAMAKQFEENERHRIHKRKNNVKLFMEVISFHRDDAEKLNNSKLEKIARKYISTRSPLSVSIATVHRDKAHTHLHFVFSGCEYRTGKSTRLSKSEFKERKLIMERFQRERFPELKRSEIQHVKKNA